LRASEESNFGQITQHSQPGTCKHAEIRMWLSRYVFVFHQTVRDCFSWWRFRYEA